MGDIARWTMYPVRSEQIKAAGTDDVDHAEWVIRVDGPLPDRPVEVAPLDQLKGAVLTQSEAGLLEVLAREEAARHEHPPHALVSALGKLRTLAGGR